LSSNIVVLPAAALEIKQALEWYEVHSVGLGVRFTDILDQIFEKIAEHPTRYSLVLKDVRRVKIPIFPYAVYYRCIDETVFVIACFHSRRNPIVWQSRV
jgi:plasmid stabilization system protein ParE